MLEFLNGAGEFFRVHTAPGVHPSCATVHEEEGELAHDDMLRAHRNDGGGGRHEAVEVDSHLAMFNEHLAYL